MSIHSKIVTAKKEGRKLFSVLIDPDKSGSKDCEAIAQDAQLAGVDLLFVGSSVITNGSMDECIDALKKNCNIPVVIFPGSTMQISDNADAILFLSLISGRNAEMLIGRQVIAAPLLKTSGLEIISTGYMLIDSGAPTAVSYMSNTIPIPHDKNDIALCTALAGEMMGMKIIYMDAGSGARTPISTSMIETIHNNVNIPLIVGGGIRTPEKAIENCIAGADVIVVGNSIEKDRSLIEEISDAIHAYQTS